MKKSLFIMMAFLMISLFACTESKKLVELQDQNRRQGIQLSKLHEENAELSSLNFTLKSQSKKKDEELVKCQTDFKEVIEPIVLKYNHLLEDYTKLQASNKVLNDAYETSKENAASVIMELEEKTRTKAVKVKKSTRKVKAKKRRRR
ncbi:hypothetical protein VB264_19720 [Arcicella aquatica]|uniref:Lipoprotein n=1 Tax=Arcicella aquatica TaxID=217141 RepID=A0ABU5QSH0_9BACT|nr:hypothetical protein [Arcicella aquatica]MEA5260036.1 hypothetical protein [Arcicella aquatica]